jgi:hypothetical protein
VEFIQELEGCGISDLCQTDGVRFSQRLRLLRRCRHAGIAWSVSGQRSCNGASNGSDAPDTSWSCIRYEPALPKKYAATGVFSRHARWLRQQANCLPIE